MPWDCPVGLSLWVLVPSKHHRWEWLYELLSATPAMIYSSALLSLCHGYFFCGSSNIHSPFLTALSVFGEIHPYPIGCHLWEAVDQKVPNLIAGETEEVFRAHHRTQTAQPMTPWVTGPTFHPSGSPGTLRYEGQVETQDGKAKSQCWRIVDAVPPSPLLCVGACFFCFPISLLSYQTAFLYASSWPDSQTPLFATKDL